MSVRIWQRKLSSNEKNKRKTKSMEYNMECFEDYSIIPEITAYDERGKADLYWNYVIGAIYKYFDYRLLDEYFDTLRYDSDYLFYRKLMMLGLEGCIFEKDSKNRPVLAGLRHECGKRALENRDRLELFDEILAAYFSRVYGYDMKVSDNIKNLLDELNFDINCDTRQVIDKMNQIIKKYFEPDFSNEFYIKRIKTKFNFFGWKTPQLKGQLKEAA